MQRSLEENFLTFKLLTEEAIKAFEEDNIDRGQELINKREELIAHIDALKYDKEKIKQFLNKEKLNILEKKLGEVIRKRMLEAKNEIDKFHSSKEASLNYNKFSEVVPKFLNKKI